MPRAKHIYPSDDEIVAGIEKEGNVSAYTKTLDIPRESFRSHIYKNGPLAKRIERAIEEKKRIPKILPSVDKETTLKYELAEANRQLKRISTEDIKETRIREDIKDNLESKISRYKPKSYKKSSQKLQHEFVLLWSDIHAGETVSSADTGGVNEYNWNIMLKRHQKLFEAVCSYQENRGYPIETLHIFALGDMLSGNIHEELRETNEIPLHEATVQYGLDASDWIEQFIPHFRKINIRGVVGNHPRETKKSQHKRKFSNADWVFYQIMQQRLAKMPSVSFDIPKAQKHPADVCGRRVLLAHGDQVGPSAMVGVPAGGIVRYVARLRNQYAAMNLPIDHFVCGHFHEANQWNAKLITINGSMIGPNEYGLDRFGEAAPPMQLLLTFNKKWGLTDTSFIDLR